jgi:GNAT superfamily N-acetyltransferase
VIVGIHARTFGLAPSRVPWVLAAAAAPDVTHHVAFVGRTPVGAGAVRIEGDLAWLGGGATLTRWRRRGVHAALIAARLRHARRRGCRWAWVETAPPAPGRPGGSRRNLIRLGFEPVVVKPTLVWQDGAS